MLPPKKLRHKNPGEKQYVAKQFVCNIITVNITDIFICTVDTVDFDSGTNNDQIGIRYFNTKTTCTYMYSG